MSDPRPILLGDVPDGHGGYCKVFADIDDAALAQAVGSVFGAESLPDGAVHDVLSVRLVHFPAVPVTAACIAIVPDNPRIASYARWLDHPRMRASRSLALHARRYLCGASRPKSAASAARSASAPGRRMRRSPAALLAQAAMSRASSAAMIRAAYIRRPGRLMLPQAYRRRTLREHVMILLAVAALGAVLGLIGVGLVLLRAGVFA